LQLRTSQPGGDPNKLTLFSAPVKGGTTPKTIEARRACFTGGQREAPRRRTVARVTTTVPGRSAPTNKLARPQVRAPEPTKPRRCSARPAADGGLEKVADLKPTVVVMNVHIPGLDVAGGS